ncbi:MAG: OmpA family protein [candidate division Zixibacteria bacterium]|nr:OmpA family protein [candidate division Zixibacteria bacterium]
MRIAVLLTVLFLVVSPVNATDYRYSFGAGGGTVSLSGGGFFSFDTERSISFSLGHRLSRSWQLDLEYAAFSFSNDKSAAATDSAGMLYNNSPLDLKCTRLGLRLDRKLFDPQRFLNLTVGLGGGLNVWKAVDPATNTTYTVHGENDQTADLAASELYLSGAAGLLIWPTSRLSLHITGQADYLTGAGAEFESAIKEIRDNLILGVSVKLYWHFGAINDNGEWRSDQAWKEAGQQPTVSRQPRRDSDGDGVDDSVDKCLNTPRGADVDEFGCPLDSDRDGVPDGLDDCPATPTPARDRVDIHGCPVDSDFDGVPDYADSCAFNPVGAQVDQKGCPYDSDNDGVPDGLDDCPNTLVGVEVDQHGCIDLAMFAQPMVLSIDYPPGGFDVDPHSRKRIERLAGLLNFVKDMKLDINGYTDDIGPAAANRTLSEKRAARVKGILVSLGVEEDRIKVFGQGEVNFVASNQTAEGRAKNRRIEIVFYR